MSYKSKFMKSKDKTNTSLTQKSIDNNQQININLS